jgi:hypothetical protein
VSMRRSCLRSLGMLANSPITQWPSIIPVSFDASATKNSGITRSGRCTNSVPNCRGLTVRRTSLINPMFLRPPIRACHHLALDHSARIESNASTAYHITPTIWPIGWILGKRISRGGLLVY